MTADFVTVTDAIVADLQANVTSLSATTVPAAQVHLYSPWNPEELTGQAGERHLAVWPVAEPEVREVLSTDYHELSQSYLVLVWEVAGSEAERGLLDEDVAKTFLQLHNDVRARFYVTANQTLGGSQKVWYRGTTFPERPSTVRWFAIGVEVVRTIEFT